MPRVATALLLAGPVLVGCGSGAHDAARRASWTATGRLVVAQWRAGALPGRYAAATLRVAAERAQDPSFAADAEVVERRGRR